MSFLDSLLTAGMRDIPDVWHELTASEQLTQVLEESKVQPVVIFKHSTSCGISHSIKYRLEENWDFNPGEMKFYYLDLLAHRPLSNEVAHKLGVIHQSPQVIVIKDGEAVMSASHHSISTARIRQAL